MKHEIGLALLAACLTTGGLVADDVVLTNGEAFEGVIAELEGEHVRIRLEFGELRLPAASVARIDSSRSALSDYLERRKPLLESEGSAVEWLDLARWARGRALEHSYREALLEAAAIDPGLEGLAAGMRQIGYVYDEELDRWMPYEEKMRRAGLVLHRGEWKRPEERAAEQRPKADEHSEVEAALSRTVELLAMAQLEREARESRESRESRQSSATGGPVPYGFPVAHFGGFVFAPPAGSAGDAPTSDPGALPEDLFRRPPGSLLPVGGVHRGSFRQPGSLIPSVSRTGR